MKKYTLLLLAIFAILTTVHSQIISTVVGNGFAGYTGDGGLATAASVYSPYSCAVDDTGNLYVADSWTHLIRKVNTSGVVSTIAGTYVGWYGAGGGFSGDGGPATAARLNFPTDIAIDNVGNIYISDEQNFRIRRISPLGIISTVAGNGTGGYSGDGGPATLAKIGAVDGIAVDASGNLYLADRQYQRVRRVSASGIINTVAGNGTAGYSGDGGLAIMAKLSAPFDVDIDNSGNIYIADEMNNCVRKVSTSGIITTFAGNGIIGFSGDGGAATSAQMHWPIYVAVDKSSGPHSGSIYISDNANHRLRRVNSSGIISSLAGFGTVGGYNGDGILSSFAQLYSPYGVAVGNSGIVYLSDAGNNRIRKINDDFAIAVSPSNSICVGTPVTFSVSSPIGCGAAIYQWIVNGVYVSASSSYTYLPSNGDSIRCTRSCAGGSPQSSNTIDMVVNSSVVPTISIASAATSTICSGVPVTFTSSISNGGVTPTYQWRVNGILVGTASNYVYAPASGDLVKCTLISSMSCASPASVTSSTISMLVTPAVIPSIAILPSTTGTICSGAPVFFTSSTTNGGSSPIMQWKVNGVTVGGGSAYSYIPTNGDTVRCTLTSNATCASPSTVSSASFLMAVGTPTASPFVAISTSPSDTVCEGTTVTVNATPTMGGTAPYFQWRKNGVAVGTGGSAYTFLPSDGDSVQCLMTSSETCIATSTALSNKIGITTIENITPGISVLAPVSAPVGAPVSLRAIVTGMVGGYNIDWLNYGVVFSTTTVDSTTYPKTTGTDVITARINPTADECVASTTSHIVLVTVGPSNVELKAVRQVFVYPNPTEDLIYVANVASKASYSIKDIMGRQIGEGQFTENLNTLSIGWLPAACYLLEITDTTGIVQRIKLTRE